MIYLRQQRMRPCIRPDMDAELLEPFFSHRGAMLRREKRPRRKSICQDSSFDSTYALRFDSILSIVMFTSDRSIEHICNIFRSTVFRSKTEEWINSRQTFTKWLHGQLRTLEILQNNLK